MKLLVFSDLHNSDAGLEFITDNIAKHKPDLMLFCGDLTTFGPRSFAQKAIKEINVRTLAVPGNCDPPAIHEVYDEGSFTNIHGKSIETEGFTFVGWGGSNPGVNTPFEHSEDDIFAGLEPVIAEPSSESTKPVILVSHCPPHGLLDTIPTGAHVGCTSVADIIDTYRPALTVCGHIHEAQGIYIDPQRKLQITNVGPSKLSCGAVIELGRPEEVLADPIGNVKIELLK